MITSHRPEACLSDFALDRRLGGELGTEEESLAGEHIASCVRCAQRWTALRAARDTFAAEAPPLQVRARSAHGTRRPWLFAAVGALAAAAVVSVWLRPADEERTRTKGSDWRLGFYVSHAGVIRQGAFGERVEPGDALRFTYGSSDARYLAVLSVDGAKKASTYFPASGAPPREEPGAEVALPLSTVLDDTLGDETIYGVGCAHPFDVEALRQALERAHDRPPSLPGCTVETLVVHKEAPSRP